MSKLKLEAKTLLIKLAERVQELFLEAQVSRRPHERAKLHVLYREAYVAYQEHKVFLSEQDTLLDKAAAA